MPTTLYIAQSDSLIKWDFDQTPVKNWDNRKSRRYIEFPRVELKKAKVKGRIFTVNDVAVNRLIRGKLPNGAMVLTEAGVIYKRRLPELEQYIGTKSSIDFSKIEIDATLTKVQEWDIPEKLIGEILSQCLGYDTWEFVRIVTSTAIEE